MIAKLYKGPQHGKKYEVRDGQPFIYISGTMKKGVYQYDASPFPSFLSGTYIKTGHTHPDGSVFFVWEGWR